jgi:copper chaperone CopZ
MGGFVFANESIKKGKTETVEIKTSAKCGHCEERITKALTYTKGVVDIDFNDETKVVAVTYKTKKTNPEALRKAISMAGYQADEMPANQAAFDALSDCCKKDGVKCSGH